MQKKARSKRKGKEKRRGVPWVINDSIESSQKANEAKANGPQEGSQCLAASTAMSV
jgi:hypothetical protein